MIEAFIHMCEKRIMKHIKMVLKKEDGVQVINGVKSIKVTYKHV
jgi:hypothetical protein